MPMPPSLDPARGHRGRGPLKLPAEGRKGDPPPWPLRGTRPKVAERDTWADLWATPQAVAWEAMGPGIVREVARYCRAFVEASQADAPASYHAQVTAMADRLGLSPKAMRLLLWEVVPDEVAEARAESTSARGRIRAV